MNMPAQRVAAACRHALRAILEDGWEDYACSSLHKAQAAPRLA